MKDELAERLLARIMGWNSEQLVSIGQDLQAMASFKYDTYGGFRPGEKFLESLSRWLWQLEPPERERTVQFVRDELVFIAEAQMSHLIDLVYPDILRPMVRDRIAKALDVPHWRVGTIVRSREFEAGLRKLLVVGLADGARLDKLRRASPELSHEQFFLDVQALASAKERMLGKLESALEKRDLPGPARFEHVVFVDDFTGSGYTLIHPEGEGYGGKLMRASQHLADLGDALAPEVTVTVVIYVASAKAEQRVRECLRGAGLPWELRIVQRMEETVTDEVLTALCRKYYDPVLTDQHKGEAVLGYSDCALPLVLHHNTPNNSISLLWGHTRDRSDAKKPFDALFPRYERHHANRP